MANMSLNTIWQALLIVMYLLLSNSIYANTEIETNLENIQHSIKAVEKNVDDAKTRYAKLQEELKNNELETTKTISKLNKSKQKINQKNKILKKLQANQNNLMLNITNNKQQIAKQIRQDYMIRRNTMLKLLLNQKDHKLISRTLNYYNIKNRYHHKKMMRLQDKLAIINKNKTKIENQTMLLNNLYNEQEKKLNKIKQYRTDRQKIIAQLDEFIASKTNVLSALKDDEKRMYDLLHNLEQNHNSNLAFENLKGKLKLPVQGTIISHYGQSIKNTKIYTQGILIHAKLGDPVSSIADGKVIFSDWFKHLGLLIIIDHGGNILSLYGHNQSLLKSNGDWVSTGENIATVGDSGGRLESGLYFEIREHAKPINPELWFAKQ